MSFLVRQLAPSEFERLVDRLTRTDGPVETCSEFYCGIVLQLITESDRHIDIGVNFLCQPRRMRNIQYDHEKARTVRSDPLKELLSG